jgi:hypothetical protein
MVVVLKDKLERARKTGRFVHIEMIFGAIFVIETIFVEGLS